MSKEKLKELLDMHEELDNTTCAIARQLFEEIDSLKDKVEKNRIEILNLRLRNDDDKCPCFAMMAGRCNKHK